MGKKTNDRASQKSETNIDPMLDEHERQEWVWVSDKGLNINKELDVKIDELLEESDRLLFTQDCEIQLSSEDRVLTSSPERFSSESSEQDEIQDFFTWMLDCLKDLRLSLSDCSLDEPSEMIVDAHFLALLSQNCPLSFSDSKKKAVDRDQDNSCLELNSNDRNTIQDRFKVN